MNGLLFSSSSALPGEKPYDGAARKNKSMDFWVLGLRKFGNLETRLQVSKT